MSCYVPSVKKEVRKEGPNKGRLYREYCNSVRKEVCWTISNMVANGNEDHIQSVINANLMPKRNVQIKFLRLLLETIKSLLISGNSNSLNPYIECLEGCDGFEKVRFYSNHNNVDITTLVNEILYYKKKMDF
ncbi:hypothetical protein ABK040_001169 [Willaertia magna]